MTRTIKPSDLRRTALEIKIRDCYTATVSSFKDDGFTTEQAHQSAWRNTMDTFPRVSTGDLALAVRGLEDL